MSEESRAIVIDNGSDSLKAGFAGDEDPATVPQFYKYFSSKYMVFLCRGWVHSRGCQ